jgi:hypothetical protein
MEQHISTHTFEKDHEWETVDTLWHSPFYYWQKNGLRVSPRVQLRVVTIFGRVVAESEHGWVNIGGASSMLFHITQAKGRKGQKIRVEIGEEITEETEVFDSTGVPVPAEDVEKVQELHSHTR